MKLRILSSLAGLMLLVLITFTSSCTTTVVQQHKHPRHKQRTVWVSGVRYRQVYYIENVTNNVIIVTQTEYPDKKHKHHNNKGKHKGH